MPDHPDVNPLDEIWAEVTTWNDDEFFLKGKPMIKDLIEVVKRKNRMLLELRLLILKHGNNSLTSEWLKFETKEAIELSEQLK